MYRCKDCGKEFQEKIDYCDCGNNVFDYFEDNVFVQSSIQQQEQPRQSISAEEKSLVISWIFFIICILLSLIVWFIPIKIEQSIKEEILEPKTDIKTIPNLEKIWNSAPPKIDTAQEEKAQTPLDVIREEIPDKILPKPIEVKKPVQTNSVQPKPVTQPKPVVQNKPIINQNKSTVQNKQTSQNKPITQNKPVQQTQKQTPTQNKQTANPNNLKPANKTQKPTEIKPKNVYNPDSLEMLKYKGSLRSALFAKLPIGSVQGSGACSVQFAVDKTGKLINRSFSKQSDNKSLNDAVYYMLMSVPRFASPPEGYNQELIRMNINIHTDGSYEVSIN